MSGQVTAVVAPRLCLVMAETGTSVSQLARDLGVADRLVQKWRKGDVIPSYPNVAKLAERFDKPLAWFFTPIEDAA